MKIAVVSTDGITVDEHFGRAERFLIYELDGERKLMLGSRDCVSLSVGDRDHAFDPSRFETVVDVIAGCVRVYCVRIGEKPAAELKKRGILAVVYEGPIAAIRE